MSEIEPPEKITSDYVELLMLALMFLIGAPLNLAAYTQVSGLRPPKGPFS